MVDSQEAQVLDVPAGGLIQCGERSVLIFVCGDSCAEKVCKALKQKCDNRLHA